MTFQSTVSLAQGFGVPGEIFLDGPHRAQPGIINSDGVTNPNRVGRVFTQVAGSDGKCIVGGAITDGTPFYGILANPKEYATYGSTSGTLAPSLDLPQYAEGDFVYNATAITMTLPAACQVGDYVDYNTTTGAVVTRAPFANYTGSITTTVLTVTGTPTGAPIAVGAAVTGALPGTIITSLGTGTGGAGTYNVNNSQTLASGPLSSPSALASGTARVPGFTVVRYNLTASGLGTIGCIN